MNNIISSVSQYLGFWKPESPPEPTSQELADAKKEKLANLMQTVLAKKEENVAKALTNRVNASEAILIGGDLFTMGYLAFQGAQAVSPSLATIPAIGMTTLICAEVAGVINIGVGLVCLKESIQAFANGDKKLGARLFLDFVTCVAIGAIMILAGLAPKIAALGAVGAFFTANPWLLPVLFFIVTLPLIIEISSRVKNIATKENLAAQITGDLTQLIHDPKKSVFYLDSLLDETETNALEQLSTKMEQFQADMGAKAAVEVFRLLQLLLQDKDFKEQLKKVEKEIAEWNRAQYVRLFQQALYTVAFAVSMVGLCPSINANALNAAQNFSMTGANAIPLYMDAFWPLKRNTPIVVPKVEVS